MHELMVVYQRFLLPKDGQLWVDLKAFSCDGLILCLQQLSQSAVIIVQLSQGIGGISKCPVPPCVPWLANCYTFTHSNHSQPGKGDS